MGSNGVHGEQNQWKPHFILVPLVAQGHMIPMVDLAVLLAAAGGDVTVITTPVNAARIRPVIDRIESSGAAVQFVELCFPAAEAGLPPGCENFDLIPSPDFFMRFVEALSLLGPQLKRHIAGGSKSAAAPAKCMIFDSMNGWAAEVGKSLGIPHLIFYGTSCFHTLCHSLLKKSQILKSIADDFEFFHIPGLPETVEVTKVHVLRMLDRPGWEKIREEYYAGEESAQGVLINTFEELELWDLEIYRRMTEKKVWSIGSVSLVNKGAKSQATRGKASSIDIQMLVNWLDSKESNSVMFISFGSMVRDPLSQLVEIGQGIDSALSASSSLSFIWAMNEVERSEEREKWLLEFEEKTKRRGVVIRGWAPQALILAHAAVGGFMTHCGWNSTLEAVTEGLVMATWPRFGDQFLNEKLVVDVLKVGVAVGAKVPIFYLNNMTHEAHVKSAEVRNAIDMVMDGGKEGEERRRRAKVLGEKAKKAIGEGGSSSENLKEIMRFAKEKISA